MVGGVEVQPVDQSLGKDLGVPAEEAQQAEADREHQHAFQRLEVSDGPEAALVG